MIHSALTLKSICFLPLPLPVYKDHITLQDYEIHDGMGLELYYH